MNARAVRVFIWPGDLSWPKAACWHEKVSPRAPGCIIESAVRASEAHRSTGYESILHSVLFPKESMKYWLFRCESAYTLIYHNIADKF